MLLRLLPTIALIALSSAQKTSNESKDAISNQTEDSKPLVLVATPLRGTETQNPAEIPQDIRQFYGRQQFSPEIYGLTYLQPQYQGDPTLTRIQPQIVLYGPGGQGQPILINPGNPPGNFLYPQGQGPNILVRNNPQDPPGSLFPVAGYPKPAHIPPIEKDAEEIPTDPQSIRPLKTNAKPIAQTPKPRPEKLETFTEINNQPEINTKINQDRFPETVSLRPGQRFFILNGDHIYNYPFEAQPQLQPNLPNFRYTSVEPFPQNPPKYLQPFAQEPPQFLQNGPDEQAPPIAISVPNFLLRNSFVNSQPGRRQPALQESTEKPADDGALKTAQQYFRTGLLPNQFFQAPTGYPQQYLVGQPGPQVPEAGLTRTAPNEVVEPQIVGQFRFTPNSAPGFFNFKDDLENDAVVVDASYDASSNNYDEQGESLRAEEDVSTTTIRQSTEKAAEPSMAQAGPQATAIAGPGGVAGSAPRGTALVGKGGLAVSSPQATAVAGTKEEEKKKPAKIG